MIGKIGIALTAADSNRVYALVENENGGLLVSDDAGATWKMINTGRNIRQRAFYYTHVFADHQNKDIVYALNTSAFRSVDGGKTFAEHGQRHPRRSPRHLDRSRRSAARRARQRRRRRGDIQRRRRAAAVVVGPGIPDRAVLSRDHDEARAVSPLRRAAGQQHDVRAEHQRHGGPRRPAAGRSVLRGRRQRGRLHRARSEGHRRVLLRARTTAASSRG